MDGKKQPLSCWDLLRFSFTLLSAAENGLFNPISLQAQTSTVCLHELSQLQKVWVWYQRTKLMLKKRKKWFLMIRQLLSEVFRLWAAVSHSLKEDNLFYIQLFQVQSLINHFPVRLMFGDSLIEDRCRATAGQPEQTEYCSSHRFTDNELKAGVVVAERVLWRRLWRFLFNM